MPRLDVRKISLTLSKCQSLVTVFFSLHGQVAQLYPIFKEKLSVFLTCKNTFINVRSSFLSFFFHM